MHGVFKELINGLQYRGPGGFVYVKGDRCAYCFPKDMPNEEFAHGMEKMIQNTKDVFFVAEERDNNVHILTYARHVVFESAEEELKRLTSEKKSTPNAGPPTTSPSTALANLPSAGAEQSATEATLEELD